MINGDWVYVDGFGPGRVFVPDVKILCAGLDHRYRPQRGYAASLAVERVKMDADGRPVKGVIIGWIDTRCLGYETARDWVKATGYKLEGDGV